MLTSVIKLIPFVYMNTNVQLNRTFVLDMLIYLHFTIDSSRCKVVYPYISLYFIFKEKKNMFLLSCHVANS